MAPPLETLRVSVTNAHAGWSQGAAPCRDIATIRARLQGLLFATKEIRDRGLVGTAPTVEVDADLSMSRALLGLAPDVALELIDVPGLRVVADEVNEPVIQAALGRCRAVLVVDATRMSAFEELLAVVRTVDQQVASLGGRLCVILNKVDRLGSEDADHDAVVERLRCRVAATIHGGFDVVATSGLLLAGATELAALSAVSPMNALFNEEGGLEALRSRARALLLDGGMAIRRSLRGDREARREFDAIEGEFEAVEGSGSSGMRHLASALARCAFRAARGAELFTSLRGVVAAESPRSVSQLPLAEGNRLLAVAHLFQAMIEADGRIEPEELALGSALLQDFARVRGLAAFEGEHVGLSSHVVGADPVEAVAAMLHAGVTREEREWCIGALLGLAAVDKQLPDSEAALMDWVRQELGR